MKTGIYQIINISNDKRYIGSAVDLKKRKREHFQQLKKNTHSNRYLKNAYNKYGVDNFKFEVLLYCSKEDLIFYEQRAINAYDFKTLYNIAPTAGSALGVKHTDEVNIAKSKRQKGRIVTEETRLKISIGHKGKKLSTEHCLKRS